MDEKSCQVIHLSELAISSNAHMQTSVIRCSDFCSSFFFFFLHQQPFATPLSCSAFILLQPWRYEKRRKQKHLLHQVGGKASAVFHTNTRLMSTASCDVCHIESIIKARVRSCCHTGEPGDIEDIKKKNINHV